jgi:hypothetical protein
MRMEASDVSEGVDWIDRHFYLIRWRPSMLGD